MKTLLANLGHVAAMPRDPGSKLVLPGGGKPAQLGRAGDLFQPHRSVDLHAIDPGTGGIGNQKNVAAQTAARHRALDLPGRGRIDIGQHDRLERRGHDQHAEHVLAARAGRP